MLSNEEKFEINTFDIAWQEIKRENLLYILNLKTKKFIYFEDISNEIWNLIKKRVSLQLIVDELLEIYEVPRQILENDVKNIINTFYLEGVIVKC